jgi:hypothetical protein
VCRLEKLPTGYARLVCRDKVQKSHQPVRLPLAPCLNPYMHAYMVFCRPAVARESEYVFTSGCGGVWSDASRDIKSYMRDTLGIDPDELEPTGRFVHCTRKIALAAYSTRVRFDMQLVRNFAKLMRHSVATSEQYYAQWSDTVLSQEGAAAWSRWMLGVETPDADVAPYTPSLVRRAPDFVDGWFRASFVFSTPHVAYDRADAYTQTDPVLGLGPAGPGSLHLTPPGAGQIHPMASIPTCDRCTSVYSLFGPYGLRRDTAHFGCYYVQCRSCDGTRPTAHARWYPLGTDPPVPSCSTRPRNASRIRQHVDVSVACKRAKLEPGVPDPTHPEPGRDGSTCSRRLTELHQ